jgi:hypothetical protein
VIPVTGTSDPYVHATNTCTQSCEGSNAYTLCEVLPFPKPYWVHTRACTTAAASFCACLRRAHMLLRA